MDEHAGALSRRHLFGAALGAAAAGSVMGATDAFGASTTHHPSTPHAALEALMQGNKRYMSGQWHRVDYSPVGERRASSQKPFAGVLTCADSRVAPSLVFDVERGNIFSTQVAGNSLDDSTIGSLEYAVAVLGIPLIVVLGHSDCGAVKSAIDVAAGTKTFPAEQYGSIGAVVDQVVPAVQEVPAADRSLETCVAANVEYQVQALRSRGPIIPAAIRAGKLRVGGGIYEIATGQVHWI